MGRRKGSGEVFKNAVGRIVWGGKGAVFLANFAAAFAMVFAVAFAVAFAAANALLGAWGVQPLFGESHRANPVTQLAANGGAGRGTRGAAAT
jgi:hypothetical protein